MNILDIVVLLPCAFFTIRGFMKGFILELSTLLGLVIGIIGAVKFTTIVLVYLPEGFVTPFSGFLAYLAVFIAIFIFIFLMGKVLEKALKIIQLNFFNRVAGAIFGFVKILFILSLLFWLTQQINFIPEETKEASLSYPLIASLAPVTLELAGIFFPFLQDMAENVEFYFEQLKELE